jgi:hypothetical protein
MEAKLILSSHYRGWTIAENFITEKNLAHAPYEFGYAVGMSRPFALAARPDRCLLCPENFAAGVELYVDSEHTTILDYGIPRITWHRRWRGPWRSVPLCDCRLALASPVRAPAFCSGSASLTRSRS